MRENMGLYRGKRKLDGKWLEGTYLHLNLGRDFICDGTVWIGTLNPCKEEIIPKTVGQFTGLTDKNGKKVFEDDILKADWSTVDGEDITGTFIADLADYMGMVELAYSHEIEVIGNIHDNPELMPKNSAIDSPSDNP